MALEGTAWINVKDVLVEGLPDPLELRWTSVQNWQASIPLTRGFNAIILRAYDYRGREVAVDTINVTFLMPE